MLFLKELEKLIIGSDIIEKEIFAEIVTTIKFVNEGKEPATEEKFVNILKYIIEDDSRYYNLVDGIQKNILYKLIIKYDVDTCVNAILKTYSYNFWNYKVTDIINRIKKYFGIMDSKEEVMQEIERLVVTDGYEKLIFDDIVYWTDKMMYDLYDAIVTCDDDVGIEWDKETEDYEENAKKGDKYAILKVFEMKNKILGREEIMTKDMTELYIDHIYKIENKIIHNTSKLCKLYENKDKSKN